MARSAVAMAVAMVVLVVAMAALVPSASAACGAIQSMLPCLPAARDGVAPTSACCQACATYSQGGTPAGQACLCGAVTNPTAKAAGMKLNYAVLIPQKCNLNYKAGYVCNGMKIPGGHA